MEKWFALKNSATQAHLLKLSARKAPSMRKRHQEEEQDVLAQRKLILEQHHQHQEALKQARVAKKDNIVRQIQRHAGPCRTPADVDRLLGELHLQRERKEALQLESNYHKIVLGVRSPLLRASPSVQVLADNLKQYLRQHMEGPPLKTMMQVRKFCQKHHHLHKIKLILNGYKWFLTVLH